MLKSTPFNDNFLTGKERVIHNGLEIDCEVFTKGHATIVALNRLAIRLHDHKEQYVSDPEINTDNIGVKFKAHGKTIDFIVSVFITKILFNELDQIAKVQGVFNFNLCIAEGTAASNDYDYSFVTANNLVINVFCNNMVKNCELKFGHDVTHNSKPLSPTASINQILNLLTILNLPQNKIPTNKLIYFTIQNGIPHYTTQKKEYTLVDNNFLSRERIINALSLFVCIIGMMRLFYLSLSLF